MSSATTDKPTTNVGLLDGKEASRGNQDRQAMSGSCSTSRIWMVLAFVFFVISVALAAYLAYEKLNEEEATQEKEIVKRYPGYFRTEEEQAWYEAQYQGGITEQNVTVVNATESYPTQNYCNFSCGGNGNPARKRRQVAIQRPLMEYIRMYMSVQKLHKRATVNGAKGPPVYHGCCISRHFFTSPDFAENGLGNTVELVQFDKKRQYFPTWECKQASNCDGCGCAQETMLMTAVVKNSNSDDNDDDTVLNFIRLPGCCKCFNGLR